MRKLFVLLAAAMTTAASAEVAIPFDVEAPAWTKVAKCTADNGVNIRQKPSATAPKLMYNENAIDNYDIPAVEYAQWSTRAATGGWTNQTFVSEAPVIEESAGWLQLAGEGPKYTPGWVSAKFCSLTPILPIAEDSFKDLDFLRILTGEYAGYGVYFSYNEMNNDVTVDIGRLVDGKLVCPYSLYIADVQGSANGKSYLEKTAAGAMVMYCADAHRGEWGPSIALMPDTFISQLFKYAVPAKGSLLVVCRYADGQVITTVSTAQ